MISWALKGSSPQMLGAPDLDVIVIDPEIHRLVGLALDDQPS